MDLRSSAPTFSIWQLGFGFAYAREFVAAGFVFGDELLGEAAVLDVVEEGLHRFLDFIGDDTGTGYVVSPLGCVGDGVAHVGEAAAVHKVDDKFEFVEDLEVSELGLVACFDESLKACFNQRAGAAAENGLLAEEVGFGLFGEGGLKDPRAGATDALGVTECEGERVAAGVLFDGDETGDCRRLR